MATSTNSSPTTTNVPRVDTHLAKFSQASIVVLTALAFILNQPIIVALTAFLTGAPVAGRLERDWVVW